MTDDIAERLDALRRAIDYHAHRYYVLDDLKVLVVLQRENYIASSKPWMHASLDEFQAQGLCNSFSGWHQPIRAACVRNVI